MATLFPEASLPLSLLLLCLSLSLCIRQRSLAVSVNGESLSPRSSVEEAGREGCLLGVHGGG